MEGDPVTMGMAHPPAYHIAHRGFVHRGEGFQRLKQAIGLAGSADHVHKAAQLFRHHEQHFVLVIE